MQDGDSVMVRGIFGYKLHLISSTGSIIVPLRADFTTMISSSSSSYKSGR